MARLGGGGRAGRRSRLTLLDNQESLTRRRLRDLLSQGQLAQAVRLAEDRLDLLTPLLIEQLGQATREGRQILRVPYYRPLPRLLPTGPLRRSEIHLSRQIFNGLTRRNEENGEIEGSGPPLGVSGPLSLALLPEAGGAFSPHYRELVVEDVVESLLVLRDRPLFAHLARLESPWPRTWIFISTARILCCPSCWPSRWRPSCRASSRGGGFCPATGRHRSLPGDRQRSAAAVPRGIRRLLRPARPARRIDIWMLPELAERLESHLQLGRDSPELGTMRGESELESGCYFLLQDDRSAPCRIPPCASGWPACSTPLP